MNHRVDRRVVLGATLALATACADSNTGPSVAALERSGIALDSLLNRR